jgi:hypothetical protein
MRITAINTPSATSQAQYCRVDSSGYRRRQDGNGGGKLLLRA